MKQKLSLDSIMHRAAGAIIRYRYLIFVLFAIAAVYCAIGVGKVRINEDITAFLPDDVETRKGITVMQEEFETFASANIMVSNVSYELAERLAEEIRQFPHVTDVAFDDTDSHFTDSSALFSVSFDEDGSKEVQTSFAGIKEHLVPYDSYISSDIGYDVTEELASQMGGVIILAAIVIVGVLLFTSRSYFEVVIFGIVFLVAALLNMGTNFWLKEVSSITHSIAVILQLALAIDYAIIFAHRYQDEAAVRPSDAEALTEALAKSIIEISSSSLTTISGLVALTLMQFRLGRDLGIVLGKSIVCSMITVFFLMPGLIMLFPRAIKRTMHRNLIWDVTPWGRFLMKSKNILVIVFVLILPVAFYLSGKTEYAFADSTTDMLIYSESRAVTEKITSTFDNDTYLALIVPKGNYEAEKAILQEVKPLEEIRSATGLAGIEAEPGRMLTDSYTPRMFAELLDIDIELARLLYMAYGAEHTEYQAVFGETDDYAVPAVDMFLYLFEKMDQGFVTLDAAQQEQIDDLRTSLERGVKQLMGTKHDRMVFSATVPVEGEESIALVERVREIAEQYYDSEEILVIGDITSARDLSESYSSDSLRINLLTCAFVFVILLFTFRSFVGALLLVLVIQGSVWINFSFPYLQNFHTFFVTNMIVSAIQMGATIDYAIVLMSHYLTLRKELPKKEAMARAVNEAFPTILTSGSIMTIAGFLIAYRVSYVYVGHIGLAVGRGALISVILVLSVLPQLIVLLDGAIEKTTFHIRPAEEEEAES